MGEEMLKLSRGIGLSFVWHAVTFFSYVGRGGSERIHLSFCCRYKRGFDARSQLI